MTRTTIDRIAFPPLRANRSTMLMSALAITVLLALPPVTRAQERNTKVSAVLGQFDINGNRSGPDNSVDSDGDGLPDTWEVGGLDVEGTDVPFPRPDAIVPGTPPTSIFSRQPVRTSATSRDTDGDGLTDFVEVFGLKFIDDDGDGLLSDALTEPDGEWFDFNGDGMPSIGEYPARNVLIAGAASNYDFDGFVFTDPTNRDTDGDGIPDGTDNDPLINPRSFGVDSSFFPSGTGDLATDQDLDNDGLGNGMDLGNDVSELIDNPGDLRRVLEVFRPDLLGETTIRIPEGLIEDLLGADWNGDGLFRLTDIKDPHFGVAGDPGLTASIRLFNIGDPAVDLGFVTTPFPAAFLRTTYYNFATRGAGGTDVPLPYQELLKPAGRSDNVFLPDPRIWTVLYAWRMPGFDIDGNGFIGFDGASFSGSIEVFRLGDNDADPARPDAPSSEHVIPGIGTTTGAIAGLDGVVATQLPSFCAGFGVSLVSFSAVGLLACRGRSRANRRKSRYYRE